MKLTEKHCVPCEGGTPPFTPEQVAEYQRQLPEAWEVKDNRKISKKFLFDDFKQAMAFVNRVADLAEEQGHHPDIYIYYSKVKLELWTHAIGGLSENDFIMAAKIEEIKDAGSLKT